MARQSLVTTEKVSNAVGTVLSKIGTVILVVMMMFTVTDVFLRYFFNRPILGSAEITEFLMVTVSFLALVCCTMTRAHVKVDLVMQRFPLRVQIICDAVFYLFSLGLYFLIGWRTFLRAIDLLLRGQVSDVLDIPVYPFYFVVAITSGVVGLLLLTHLVQSIAQLVKR